MQQGAGNQAVSRWIKVGDANYPRRNESHARGASRLINDYTEVGEDLTEAREARLRALVAEDARTSAGSFAALSEILDVQTSDGVEAAVDWAAAAKGFRSGLVFVSSYGQREKAFDRVRTNPDVFVIVAGLRPANVPGDVKKRLLAAQNAEALAIVLGMIRRRSGMAELNEPPADRPGRTIWQTTQERGDMHDVRPALAIEPTLSVVVKLGKWEGWSDAAEILNYYKGYENRVFFTTGPMEAFSPHERERDRKANIEARRATTILESAIDRGGDATRTAIKQVTTGADPISPQEKEDYLKDLRAAHWDANPPPMVLVNFRDSGHARSEIRQLSHPELDTGTEGLQQLLAAVEARGFLAVPAGKIDDEELKKCPNLLEYWKFPSCQERPGQPRRLREYRLMRFIAEEYAGRVFALAMRSGGTDALVYAGIPTISLDIKLDKQDRAKVVAAGLATDPGGGRELSYPYGHGGSWKRAAKRVTMFPAVFHQVFMGTLRDDTGKEGTEWKGKIADKDLETIGEALDVFAAGVPEPQKARMVERLEASEAAKTVEAVLADVPALDEEPPEKEIVVAAVEAKRVLSYAAALTGNKAKK